MPSAAAFFSPRTDTGTTATSGLSTSWPCARQMGTQRTRADGQHDVVDRRPEARLERPHLRHVQLGEGHRPVGAHRRLERVGRAQRDRHRAEPVVDGAAGQPHGRAADFACGAHPPHWAADERSGTHRSSTASARAGRPGATAAQGSVAALPSGVRSSSLASISAPATPSITEWWTLAMSPTLPSAIPSMTCISQGGCSGVSGRPITCATLARNSASPPGAGKGDAVQMVGQVEIGVVHPTRMVQSERDGHQTTAERLERRDPRLQHGGDPFEACTHRAAWRDRRRRRTRSPSVSPGCRSR